MTIDLTSEPLSGLLPRLLADHASGGNILWATQPPAGVNAPEQSPMQPGQLLALPPGAICPRSVKDGARQQKRTRAKGEVSTPAWVVCLMCDMLDERWFRRRSRLPAHALPERHSWEVPAEPVYFNRDQNWQAYVRLRELEICCGEAPFLCSRYDAATGEPIPVGRRIGLLDRKLRVVGEQCADEAQWRSWARIACQSCYGYEFQGDSLLLARCNFLLDYAEHYEARWHKPANDSLLRDIADIASWNLWQMDGLTHTLPFRLARLAAEQLSTEHVLGTPPAPGATPCLLKDWRTGRTLRFDELIRKPAPATPSRKARGKGTRAKPAP